MPIADMTLPTLVVLAPYDAFGDEGLDAAAGCEACCADGAHGDVWDAMTDMEAEFGEEGKIFADLVCAGSEGKGVDAVRWCLSHRAHLAMTSIICTRRDEGIECGVEQTTSFVRGTQLFYISRHGPAVYNDDMRNC